MWLFRKGLDISRTAARSVQGDDLTVISRLLRDSPRRYHGLNGVDLPALLAANHGVVLAAPGEIYGVALVGAPTAATCWLRAVALADGLETRPALGALVPALEEAVAGRGVREIFFAGDDSSDAWLSLVLQEHGYLKTTEILVYEKPHLDIPAAGNPAVQVRPAADVDLPEVMRLDRACFEPQWTKDGTILGPAIEHGPYFVVAELEHEPVGYAYATTHFGGRLVHLVRIAVDPARRGAGIGVRLLADVVAFAEEQHAAAITLNTQAYNARAQRLYSWFGFAPTGERQTVLRRAL
ncbi:MAG TPA: GNAT family N-acetyltransferase [Chloroflexaceae bacterium]|nr:GNAT family N-acetyltransferase [Chloroflexaceae bacterium]